MKLRRKSKRTPFDHATQVTIATTRLRFAAIELNRLEGPYKTATALYFLRHQFLTPGDFQDVAYELWKEAQPKAVAEFNERMGGNG